MKWTIRILILFFIIYGALALYDSGSSTGMAAVLFFVALPYTGYLIAQFSDGR